MTRTYWCAKCLRYHSWHVDMAELPSLRDPGLWQLLRDVGLGLVTFVGLLVGIYWLLGSAAVR